MGLTPGQISLWDIEVTKKPREIINKRTPKKIEEHVNSLEPTEEQQKFLEQNKIIKNGNLSRIIKYCGGGLGIELQLVEGYKTIYVNKEGQEEFSKDKRFPVLPMDKILYYKTADIPLNSLQEERLHNLKVRYPMAKIIKRKGDENVILILEDKVLSITPRWMIELKNVKAVYEVAKEDAGTLRFLQHKVKVGDYVQARYGKELVEGTIVREYGLGREILNIVFDGKHTAIGRTAVVKILK